MYLKNPDVWTVFFGFIAIFTYRTQSTCTRHSRSMDAKENNFSKHFSSDEKKVAIAFWKAKVPVKTISEQSNMSERTLWRILTHAKKNPNIPVLARKAGTERTQRSPPTP